MEVTYPVASGLSIGILRSFASPWPEIVEAWQRYDGWEEIDSIWGVDHFMRPSAPQAPHFDGWTALASLAALTKRARIGLLVTCNTFRHPSLLAKMATTVDHASGGRLELGIGAGWFEPEHTAFGIPFPSPGERAGRVEEAVVLLDALLRVEGVTFSGRYYQTADATLRPGSVQRPRPPITIGGHGPRMIKVAARYADRFNTFGTVAEMRERHGRLSEELAAIGRDSSTIIRSCYGGPHNLGADPWESSEAFVDVIGRYTEETGITEFILEPPTAAQVPVARRILEETLPGLR
jgi:hypothetical protein